MSNPDSPTVCKPPCLAELGLRTAPPVDRRDCPMARASDLIGDRWTMLILRDAFFRVGSFADMLADLDISRAVLSERLARLVTEGLLKKVTYQDPGSRPRQAYLLTEFGQRLVIPFLALAKWGEAITGAHSPIQMYDTRSGSPVRIVLLNGEDEEISVTHLGIRTSR